MTVELMESDRVRAESVLRSGCLEALRVALSDAGYPAAMVRDRIRAPDRLWVEPREPGVHASVTITCVRLDGWCFVHQPSGDRIGAIGDFDETIQQIATRFDGPISEDGG